MSDSIWKTLSTIDCREHTEKKGQFSYLAWTWAWAMVKENYPWAEYELLPDTVYPDGTMEVRVKISINTQVAVDGHKLVFNTLSHTMWLPVLDFKNKAIQNPNAFDINSSRMRCLVKCLAMFGLGHYIYAGESMPQVDEFTTEQKIRYIELMASEDGWGMKAFGSEVGNDIMTALFNDAPQGQKTKQKALCNRIVTEANTELKNSLGGIQAAIENNSADSVVEILAECVEVEREFVVKGLSEVQHREIQNLGVTL